MNTSLKFVFNLVLGSGNVIDIHTKYNIIISKVVFYYEFWKKLFVE